MLSKLVPTNSNDKELYFINNKMLLEMTIVLIICLNKMIFVIMWLLFNTNELQYSIK